jgi:hypothetical protein
MRQGGSPYQLSNDFQTPTHTQYADTQYADTQYAYTQDADT